MYSKNKTKRWCIFHIAKSNTTYKVSLCGI